MTHGPQLIQTADGGPGIFANRRNGFSEAKPYAEFQFYRSFNTGSPQRTFPQQLPPAQLNPNTKLFGVNPEPPVEETNRTRRNFAWTLATVRASPTVAVVVSSVWYSASTSL